MYCILSEWYISVWFQVSFLIYVWKVLLLLNIIFITFSSTIKLLYFHYQKNNLFKDIAPTFSCTRSGPWRVHRYFFGNNTYAVLFRQTIPIKTKFQSKLRICIRSKNIHIHRASFYNGYTLKYWIRINTSKRSEAREAYTHAVAAK
jgi:hypothetical protein